MGVKTYRQKPGTETSACGRSVVWNIKTEALAEVSKFQTTFRLLGGYYTTNMQTKIILILQSVNTKLISSCKRIENVSVCNRFRAHPSLVDRL
jgi:hypothetical protein